MGHAKAQAERLGADHRVGMDGKGPLGKSDGGRISRFWTACRTVASGGDLGDGVQFDDGAIAAGKDCD